jgi:hypothetical protein
MVSNHVTGINYHNVIGSYYMNEMLKRATQAVADVRRDGHHGFDDEIARAVLAAVRDLSTEVWSFTTHDSSVSFSEQWETAIDEILK